MPGIYTWINENTFNYCEETRCGKQRVFLLGLERWERNKKLNKLFMKICHKEFFRHIDWTGAIDC